MTRPLLLLVWLFVAGPSDAFTAAWKVPIERIAPGFKGNAKIPKLGKPPGESVFFLPGDELWDLSKILQIKEGAGPPFEGHKVIDVPWTGDWVVWNARSGMAIASGSRNDLLIAERIFSPNPDEVFCRALFEWSRGAKAEILRKLSGPWRSSERSKIEADGAVAKLECRHMGKDIEWFFNLSWPGADPGTTWELTSQCVTEENKRSALAHHSTGDEQWSIHGTLSRELEDGTPLSERRQIEKVGNQEKWPRPEKLPEKFPIDGTLALARYEVEMDFLSRGKDLPQIEEIQAPENLRDSVRGRFKDATAYLRHYGVALKSPGSFAAYDPLLSVLVVIGDQNDHDLCQKITADLDSWKYQNLQVCASFDPSSFGFLCQAGMKASIALKRSGEKEDLSFEVAPGWGEKNLDLTYALDTAIKGRAPQKFASTENFILGEPKTVGRYRLPDASERKVILSVADPKP